MTALIAALLCQIAAAQDISGPRLRAHVKFLASDLLEGRGVGTRGGELAEEYLAAQLALIGAKPAGDDGSYFQKVSLVGVTPQPDTALRIGGKPLTWSKEFIGTSQMQTGSVQLDAEAVFVGHGITAPEYKWDDYRGVDVRGKVVVAFTGEPPSDDAAFFGGRALTYYGRWTYKYEEALRRGAVACILVHTTDTASYGWEVVQNSWGREDMQVKLPAGKPGLRFTGWITEQAGDKLFEAVGKTAAQMLALADSRQFQASPLPMRIDVTVKSRMREVASRNVAGMIAGDDPKLTAQAVVFSAHHDHLGRSTDASSDGIYNGAVDNATGCAMVLEIARAWESMKPRPRRSALFLFVTAEENGLRGSEYYVTHPIVQPGKTALNLNLDSFYPFGRTTDIVVNGAERTSFWPQVQAVAQRMRLSISPDPRPEAGSYYRSDHFSFAKAGVPAFSIQMGTHYAGKPANFGDETLKSYNAKHYHQPSDEYNESWDFAGMVEIAKFTFLTALDVANSEAKGTWKQGDEFLPARERSSVE